MLSFLWQPEVLCISPFVWNSLPYYLRDSGVGRDKKTLKTFMSAPAPGK